MCIHFSYLLFKTQKHFINQSQFFLPLNSNCPDWFALSVFLHRQCYMIVENNLADVEENGVLESALWLRWRMGRKIEEVVTEFKLILLWLARKKSNKLWIIVRIWIFRLKISELYWKTPLVTKLAKTLDSYKSDQTHPHYTHPNNAIYITISHHPPSLDHRCCIHPQCIIKRQRKCDWICTWYCCDWTERKPWNLIIMAKTKISKIENLITKLRNPINHQIKKKLIPNEIQSNTSYNFVNFFGPNANAFFTHAERRTWV